VECLHLLTQVQIAAAGVVEIHRLAIGREIGGGLKDFFQLVPLLWKHAIILASDFRPGSPSAPKRELQLPSVLLQTGWLAGNSGEFGSYRSRFYRGIGRVWPRETGSVPTDNSAPVFILRLPK
jgi:hypothetical protein